MLSRAVPRPPQREGTLRKLLPEPLGRIAETLLKGEDDRARSGRGALSAFLIRIASAGLALL
jgi:hypothetical protein